MFNSPKPVTVKVTKFVVKTVVGFSTGFVVGNVIGNNTNPDSALQHAEVLVGGAVIGMMVADYAGQYTDRMIDDIFKTLENTSEKSTTPLQAV